MKHPKRTGNSPNSLEFPSPRIASLISIAVLRLVLGPQYMTYCFFLGVPQHFQEVPAGKIDSSIRDGEIVRGELLRIHWE
ncbi:hypothetical protein V6N12_043935 [Hibiscus sabdariffa]|uniref:Uncharacterized protein n=1 Tax=Hibiscus sabdariffa TaxID=183260 RepID=A0ABR2DGT3_9ROSI